MEKSNSNLKAPVFSLSRCTCWAKSFQSCPTLGNPLDCRVRGSSVHGLIQARILAWAAISSSKGSSWPRGWTCVSHMSCLAGRFFTTSAPFLSSGRCSSAIAFYHPCMLAKLLQLCPTLWDPMDNSPPGSSVHGILQARTLEWVATSSSRGSSWPRDWTFLISCIGRRVLYN